MSIMHDFHINNRVRMPACLPVLLFCLRVTSMMIILVLLPAVLSSCRPENIPVGDAILEAYEENMDYPSAAVTYPREGALFPPDIAAPTFRWEKGKAGSDTWLVKLKFQDGGKTYNFLLSKTEWTPQEAIWSEIKIRSLERAVSFVVLGVRKEKPEEILSRGVVSFSTSKDKVGAPIFYREVNLPFLDAVTDPSRIRWRFGSVGSTTRPPVVLENMPVCGNCHSFSSDGSRMGMDVDYANDKGSYALLDIKPEMLITKDKVISWSDYKREDGELTFGLLSRISPDGRYVVGTVKDLSIFMPKPDLAFSQLFFPIKGILVVYDQEKKTFFELPGADDKAYVQSNPVWSPDGKHIVFVRAKAININLKEKRLFITDDNILSHLGGDKSFRYDLYRIPFNEGKGGTAVPVPGASENGMSNYFPAFSPDGRWLVFCKAKNYSLLQADSELYIMPAEGGEAHRLEGNTSRMNSWHSFSPNSKWLVFSSKENGPYTQLFLTHIDDSGKSSPPVLLSNFTSSDRAANIPEFVNTTADAIRRIDMDFMDDNSFFRIAHAFEEGGKNEEAYEAYKKGLEINPENHQNHWRVALILANWERYEEALHHLEEGRKYGPDFSELRENLGRVYLLHGNMELARQHLEKSIKFDPDNANAQLMLFELTAGMGNMKAGATHFENALALAPGVHDSLFYFRLAKALGGQQTYRKQLIGQPKDQCLADYYFKQGRLKQIVKSYHEQLHTTQEGAETTKRYAHALYMLGKILAEKKYFQEALGLLEAAHEMMPSNEMFRHDLESVRRVLAEKR